MDEESRDLSGFDKNVMEIFDICKDILKTSDKRNLPLNNRKNPYLTRLEKYMKTYSKTDPEEHVVYFEKIYNNNKRFILLGPQRDSWLIDENLIISFGEDCGLKTDMKLHLSGIYSTAIKIRDEIRDEMEGLPNSSDTTETGYPASFILTLYRIFQEIVTSGTEKEKLSKHIESLETDAGIRSSKASNDPMSGLFEMAAGMAEQVSGKKISKDQMPGQQDFGKMISSVIDDPKTKSMLGNMMQEFQSTNNIGDMVSKLVGNLGAVAGGIPAMGGSNASGSGPSTDTPVIEGPQGAETNFQANDEFADFE